MMKKILLLIILTLGFTQEAPDWDCDGDHTFDYINSYQNSGSIASAVFVDGVNIGSEGDMLAAFVGDELRGLGVASSIPFGPNVGLYYFQCLIYSNQDSEDSFSTPEQITFKFFDNETGLVFDIEESYAFEEDMTLGSVINIESLYTNGLTENCTTCSGDDCSDCPDIDIDECGVCLGLGAIYECGCEDEQLQCRDLDGDGFGTSEFTYTACDIEGDIWVTNCDDLDDSVYCESNVYDCAGILCGDALEDECGVCNGSGIVEACECTDTSALNADGCCDAIAIDCAGVCGGDSVLSGCDNTCNSTLVLGCDNICDSGAVVGCDDVCDSGAVLSGCDNACNSTAVEDECGICSGTGIADGACDCSGNILDCTGVCAGLAVVDECGICEGENFCSTPSVIGDWIVSYGSIFSDSNCDNYGSIIFSIYEDGTFYDDECFGGIWTLEGNEIELIMTNCPLYWSGILAEDQIISGTYYNNYDYIEYCWSANRLRETVTYTNHFTYTGESIENPQVITFNPTNNITRDCEFVTGPNADCNGECFGDALEDECGTCNGNGLEDFYADWDEDGYGDCDYVYPFCPNDAASWTSDICGDCDNSDPNAVIEDCEGVCGGDALEDCTGVCNGSTIEDCDGVCGGTAIFDQCNVCNGDNSTCSGCMEMSACNYDSTALINDGTCWYINDGCTCDDAEGAVSDECGVCNGDNSTCFDCSGIVNGSSLLDECGICDGNNSLCYSDYVLGDGEYCYDLPTDESTLYINEVGEVYYNFTEPCRGFQFIVEGATVIDAFGGASASAGFTTWVGAGVHASVLGFSLESGTILTGNGLLTTLTLIGTPTGLSVINLSNAAAQNMHDVTATDLCNDFPLYGCLDESYCSYCSECDYNDSSYCVELDECDVCGGDSSTCQILGDTNFDFDIDVSDIVLLVDWILNDGGDDSGDINQDGNINVSDIVMLVDIILNP